MVDGTFVSKHQTTAVKFSFDVEKTPAFKFLSR